jgi:hypothetical protein
MSFELFVVKNWVEILRWQSKVFEKKMAINELDCAKKTSCVIRCYSEVVIYPLPGYD